MRRIIRVFPRRTKATPTDALAFVGEPGLFRPEADEVHISVTFTWDKGEGLRLARSWGRFYPVLIGGPAFGESGDEFEPGVFLREGYTITSRGCPNRCPWCLVPEREGPIRELPIKPGWNVLDNNLLACSDAHIERVFRMLRDQREPIQFTGGFEADRVTPRVIDLLQTIRLEQLFLAYDAEGRHDGTFAAIQRLRAAGVGLRQVRCFVLAGRDGDTMEAAEGRCAEVLEAGALPFMMLYQPPETYMDYPRDWRQLQRKWTRPAAMLARQH